MRVGPYEVLDVIGKGASGSVARARGPDGQIVAVKILRAGAAPLDERVQAVRAGRFEREGRLGSGFDIADGFVPQLDRGESPYGAFIVMPLVEGGTLRARLQRPMPVDAAVTIVRSLAAAMGRAHERGVVHRDLKPENVLFTREGVPLVADLGLAKHFRRDGVGPAGSVDLTQTGTVCGTFGYMAPEQFNSSRDVGPPADVFALGAILHECLAGRGPFECDSPLETMTKVLRGEHAALRSVRPDLPRWVSDVAERALAPDPALRFPDANALARALSRAKPGGARRLVVGGGVAVALAAVALALLVGSRRRPGAPEPPGPPAPPVRPIDSSTVVLPDGPGLPGFWRKLVPGSRTRLVGAWGSYERKHQEMVTSVAIQPGGKLGLSTSFDGMVRTFDLATGRELATFSGHKGAVRAGCFLPDARYAVSAADGECLRLWDALTGEEARATSTPGVTFYSLVATPEGLIVTGSDAGWVELWDLERGVRVRGMQHSNVEVYAVAVAPGGKTVLSGGQDGTAKLWDHSTGALLATLRHGAPVGAVAFSPNGEMAATGGADRVARLWDLSNGQPIRALEGHGAGSAPGADARVNAVAFTPDGKRLLTGSFDGTLRLWDVATGATVETLSGHASWVTCAAVSPDGMHAVSGGNDQTVRIWDLGTGREDPRSSGHASRVVRVAVAPGGRRVLSRSFDGDVALTDLETGSAVARFERRADMAIGFDADGRALLGGRAAVTAVDAQLGAELGPLPDSAAVLVLETSRGATFMGGADGRIRVQERGAGDGVMLRSAQPVLCAVLSPGLRRLLAAGKAGPIEVWDLAAREREGTLEGHRGSVRALAATDEGAVSVGEDHTVRRWDLRSRHEVACRSLPADTTAVAVSPDGEIVLVGRKDGTISLQTPDGAELDKVSLAPFSDYATAFAFAADGRTFVAGLARGCVLRFAVSTAPR